MVLVGLLDQLLIFLQLYLIELLGLLTGLGLLELWHLIYPRLLTGFGMLVFFTNLCLMEFQVRYLALCILFSVMDDFEWFWMESLHENIQLMWEFLKAPFLVLHFSYYTLIIFLVMLSVILVAMLMILFSILSVIGHLICSNNLNWLLNLNLIYETLWTGLRSGLLILMLGKLSWFHLTGLIDVKMGGSVLEEKPSFKILELTLSSKLDWGFHIIFIAKTASKKIEALIHSMKFFSPEVALYRCKCTICPCTECCCHIWACVPSCYLELLDNLQKWMCRIVGPSLAACVEPLDQRRNVASFCLFYRYYFGRYSSELAQLVPLPFSQGRSTRYSDKLHDFSVTIPRCHKDVYINSFFPRTAKL